MKSRWMSLRRDTVLRSDTASGSQKKEIVHIIIKHIIFLFFSTFTFPLPCSPLQADNMGKPTSVGRYVLYESLRQRKPARIFQPHRNIRCLKVTFITTSRTLRDTFAYSLFLSLSNSLRKESRRIGVALHSARVSNPQGLNYSSTLLRLVQAKKAAVTLQRNVGRWSLSLCVDR